MQRRPRCSAGLDAASASMQHRTPVSYATAINPREHDLDVHPPHQAIHTWQDFFIHLITITIGLFIALGLEDTVEWFHHRHLVHVARVSIRREIEDNRKQAAADLSSVQQDEIRIGNDIQHLVALRAGTKLEHSSLQYYIDWSGLSDSAWSTAQSTGAVNFMDYDTAQSLTGVYVQQRIVSDRGLAIFDAQTRAISPIFFTGDPNLMSKEEIQTVLLRSADVLLELKGLEQLLKELDQQFVEELRNEAGDRGG
jgi:hypothetical protein